MTESRRGYMTVAAGPRRFVEFAVDLALSLREHNPEGTSLLTDEVGKRTVEDKYPGLFGRVERLPREYTQDARRCNLGKFYLADATPYERTMFIDADTLVVGSLSGLWEKLEPFPFAMLGEHLTSEDDREHHGFSTRELMAEFRLGCYLKCAAGILYFQREMGKAVCRECFELYQSSFRDDPRFQQRRVQDELLFGIAGGRRVLPVFGIESARRELPTGEPQALPVIPVRRPMIWGDELARLEPGDRTFAIIHFGALPPRETMRWLMKDVRRRRRENGYSIRSVRLWHEMAERRFWSGRIPPLRVRARRKLLRLLGMDAWNM